MQGEVQVTKHGAWIELALPVDSTAVMISHDEALVVAAKIVAAVGDDEKFTRCLALERET